MNLMNIDTYVSLSILLTMVLLAGVGLWVSRKRSWKLGIVRLGVTVVAALLALPLARWIASSATDFVYGLIEPKLGPDINAFITEAPVGVAGLRVLVSMIAAPILYLTVFAVLRGIGSVIVTLLGMFVKPLRDPENLAATLSLGAVNGVVIALVSLIPLCGFMVLGGRSLNAVVDSGMTSTEFAADNILAPLNLTEEDLEEFADTLESNLAVKIVYGTIGKPAFRYLTSAELNVSELYAKDDTDSLAARSTGLAAVAVPGVNGRPAVMYVTEVEAEEDVVIEMNLEQELRSLLRTCGYVVQAIDCIGAENFTEDDKDILFDAVDSIFASESEWVELLGRDTLVSFSESWLENEAFMGMERPQLIEELEPLMECILQVLATGSSDTIYEDVHTVVDVVGDLLVYDVLSKDVDPAEMVRRLGQDGLLNRVLDKLRANPRMEVLATEVQSMGMRMVANMLDLDKLRSGGYDDLLVRVAEECNQILHLDSEARRETAARELTKAMEEHGYEVSEAVALELADKLIADLGDGNVVTVDELRQYLIDVAENKVNLPNGIR